MKITRIECIPFKLPIRRDTGWASSTVSIGRFVLIQVYTDEGIVGLGDAAPFPDWGGDHGRYSGETEETICEIVRSTLEPALTGRDPRAIRSCDAEMNRCLRGHNYAKAAIDMALWDILGKHARLPLYQLLGGAVRASVPIAHMTGIWPIEDTLKEVEGALADGVHRFQIKGGLDPDRDIDLIRRLRELYGTNIWLRLDANQGYGTGKRAVNVLRQIEDELDLVEQPVEGLDQMRAVKRAVRIPVIADESCWSSRDAFDAACLGAVDAVSIYLAKASGITGAMRVAAVAETAALPCDVNGSLEAGVGNAANLQFALAAPPVSLPSVITATGIAGRFPCKVAGTYYEDDIITRPFQVENGALLPLDGPGLGVEIDEAKLKKYRRD